MQSRPSVVLHDACSDAAWLLIASALPGATLTTAAASSASSAVPGGGRPLPAPSHTWVGDFSTAETMAFLASVAHGTAAHATLLQAADTAEALASNRVTVELHIRCTVSAAEFLDLLRVGLLSSFPVVTQCGRMGCCAPAAYMGAPESGRALFAAASAATASSTPSLPVMAAPAAAKPAREGDPGPVVGPPMAPVVGPPMARPTHPPMYPPFAHQPGASAHPPMYHAQQAGACVGVQQPFAEPARAYTAPAGAAVRSAPVLQQVAASTWPMMPAGMETFSPSDMATAAQWLAAAMALNDASAASPGQELRGQEMRPSSHQPVAAAPVSLPSPRVQPEPDTVTGLLGLGPVSCRTPLASGQLARMLLESVPPLPQLHVDVVDLQEPLPIQCARSVLDDPSYNEDDTHDYSHGLVPPSCIQHLLPSLFESVSEQLQLQHGLRADRTSAGDVTAHQAAQPPMQRAQQPARGSLESLGADGGLDGPPEPLECVSATTTLSSGDASTADASSTDSPSDHVMAREAGGKRRKRRHRRRRYARCGEEN